MPVHSFSDHVEITGDFVIPGEVKQSVSTGAAAILLPPGAAAILLEAKAATTGATLPPGRYDGQLIFITISTPAANTVTFAAAGKSNVAGGSLTSLAGLACHLLRWNASAALWYQVGPHSN